MKVLLKKSTEDMNWGGDDYDIISLNPISKAMTDCYLPQWSPSPLKAMLLKRLGTVKQMYLSLKVRYADNIVTFISLRCNLLDDVERLYSSEMDMEAVYQCLLKIGFIERCFLLQAKELKNVWIAYCIFWGYPRL